MKSLREAKGLSQVDAARVAGMTAPRWNDIEVGGRVNVKLETLSRIAEALDVDARELLTAREAQAKRRGK